MLDQILRYAGIAVALALVGYIAWKLFWFIADIRQENGSAHKDATRKGFLWKEFLACIWKTALILLIVVVFAVFVYNDKDDDPIIEEELVLTESEYAVAEYWEAKYSIPKGVMQTVSNSSAFSEIGYDSKNNALIVRFKSSGAAYVYIGFSASEWDAFRSAKSLGSYYNKNIKGKYTSYKLAKE